MHIFHAKSYKHDLNMCKMCKGTQLMFKKYFSWISIKALFWEARSARLWFESKFLESSSCRIDWASRPWSCWSWPREPRPTSSDWAEMKFLLWLDEVLRKARGRASGKALTSRLRPFDAVADSASLGALAKMACCSSAFEESLISTVSTTCDLVSKPSVQIAHTTCKHPGTLLTIARTPQTICMEHVFDLNDENGYCGHKHNVRARIRESHGMQS